MSQSSRAAGMLSWSQTQEFGGVRGLASLPETPEPYLERVPMRAPPHSPSVPPAFPLTLRVIGSIGRDAREPLFSFPTILGSQLCLPFLPIAGDPPPDRLTWAQMRFPFPCSGFWPRASLGCMGLGNIDSLWRAPMGRRLGSQG